MKSKILLLVAMIPVLVHAQITSVTEEQKQQALQTVTQFCSLLTQWSNGQRTLDTKIYSLCSGSDCSAYDDVTTNKETTLRNYLLGIQKKYPRKLSMQISAPSLDDAKIYYEPQMNMSQEWSNSAVVTGVNDVTQGAYTPHLDITYFKNAYISFKVTSNTNGKTQERAIIYDIKENKITAYITGNGTYISFLEGLLLVAEKKYNQAISKFVYAAENNRSSLKKQSYGLAGICAIFTGDYEKASVYFEKGNSFPEYYMTKGLKSLLSDNNVNECYVYVKKAEEAIEKTGESKYLLNYIYNVLGGCHCFPTEVGGRNYDIEKGFAYFKCAINEGNIEAGYRIFYYAILLSDFGELVGDECFDYLRISGERGYIPAYHWLGVYNEHAKEIPDENEAEKWYKKSADTGNPVSMACYGKLLVNSSRTSEGVKWLQKALEGNTLEKYLSDYDKSLPISALVWPLSRTEIETFLKSVSSSASNNSSSSSSYNSSSNPSYSSSSSSTNSYSSNNTNSSSSNSTYSSYNSSRYHYRKPFNKAKDIYQAGFSVGYFQKQWTVEEDGTKEKMGMFENNDYIHGIQAGLRIDPQFGWGIGMNSGVFYEYCWATSDDEYDSYGAYHYTYNEHGIYVPAHLKFTMNFSKWFQLSFYGGMGFNYVFSGKMALKDDYDTDYSEDVFEWDGMKKFNMMLEYGASIRINALQFDFTMSQGLNKWSDTDGQIIKQGRPMSVSATICF